MISRTISIYKDAYRGLSPFTWWLSLVMLVNRSGTMVVPFLTIYLTSPAMGYSIGKAGLVMGFFGLGAVAGGFVGGKLTDRFGFYPIQVITLSGGGILFILLGQMNSYPLICLFTFSLSLVNEAFRPANATAIAFYSTEENRTRSYSLNRLAINLGWAFGAATGGFLASINYTLLFWVDGITNIAACVLMIIFIPRTSQYKPGSETEGNTPILQSAYKDRKYLGFILLTTLFAICFFQLFTTLPAYYKNELHFSEKFIGVLMALNGLIIAFIEMVLVFKLEGKKDNSFYITLGVFLCGISYLMISVFHFNHILSIVMILVITFGEMLSMPFMNTFWISRSSHYNRGQYAGLYTIAWATAQTVGPAGAAQIAQLAGYNVMWWTITIICLISAIGFAMIKEE